MLCLVPLKICTKFIDEINQALATIGEKSLSKAQKFWLSVCISGVIVTNTVCWKKFERAFLGGVCANTLSKMFRRGLIDWNKLLQASILHVFSTYEITSGVLSLDDTDNKRSKNTSQIANVHKIKDKVSGGYIKGQELVFVVLVTDKITIPVGFDFYEPDPERSAWIKLIRELKKQNVSKKERPKQPKRNQAYPTKQEIALNLLRSFEKQFPMIQIKAVVADALYGSRSFVTEAAKLFGGTQVISQIKSTQKVAWRGTYISVEDYFIKNAGVPQTITVRGEKKQIVTLHGARIMLKAHGCKRAIIAMKYEGEANYRYIIASDLTWRLTDIVSAYTLRWLVEVFFSDWKAYEGWSQLAKQLGEEGSSRGLILSLLVDHCLLVHPDQKALVEDKLPASTVGSLRDRERVQAILQSIEHIAGEAANADLISEITEKVKEAIPLRPSTKHMNGRDLGRLEPTPSLVYKFAA